MYYTRIPHAVTKHRESVMHVTSMGMLPTLSRRLVVLLSPDIRIRRPESLPRIRHYGPAAALASVFDIVAG